MDVKEQIQKMRPIDDTFFEVLIEDKLVCQEILRIVMEDASLEVLAENFQDKLSFEFR